MENIRDINNKNSNNTNGQVVEKMIRELQVSVHNLVEEVERLNENCNRLDRYQNKLKSLCHVWDGWIKRATNE